MASIYKRNGIFWIAFYHNNKLHRQSLRTKDRGAANYLKNQKEQELTEGKAVVPNLKVLCEDLLTEYDKFCLNRRTVKTHKEDMARIRHFLRVSNIITLKDVSEKRLQDYLDKRVRDEKNKISLNTANHIITTLKTWLNFAVRRRYIYDNPLRHFKKYKLPINPPRFLSKEEIHNLLNIAKHSKLYHPIACALYTGMRQKELFSMEWQDIDFDRNVITIRNKDGFMTKSKRFRVIPLHKALKAILQPIKLEKGPCFSTINHRKSFRKIAKDANLKGIGWHTLRHTFASHLVMDNTDLTTVRDLLGHASIVTTQIYSHLTKEHIKNAVEKLSF